MSSQADRISTRLCLEAALFVWRRRVEFLVSGWTWLGLLILLYSALQKSLQPLLAATASGASDEAVINSVAGFPVHILFFIAVATALLAYNWHSLVLGRPNRITLVSGWSVEALRYAARMMVAYLLIPVVALFVLALVMVPFVGSLGADTLTIFMAVMSMVLFFYLTTRNLALSAFVMSGQPNPMARSWLASGKVLAVPAGCILLLILVSVLLSSGTAIIGDVLRLFSKDIAAFVEMLLGYVAQFVILAWGIALSQRLYDWMMEGHRARIDS